MNKKITSLLLICLVALSIVYGWGNTALPSHETLSVDGVASGPTTIAEDPGKNARLSRPKPNFDILGDPVDDVKPH